jgi:hypothetical protein
MPQKLSEPLEDQIRKYIIQNATPSAMEGYDPTQSDTTASDFILVTSDNDNYGDYYPLIYVSEQDNGPTIPNSGNTNVNGVQGDGSGNNQFAIKDVTISVQAVENGPYLNNIDYDQLVFEIYAELQAIFGDPGILSDAIYVGELTPPTITRSSDEQDNSTETWIQRQGTVPVGIQFTP